MGKRGTKKAERALPGRRELLAAVDSLNVAVVATSPEGEITSWNEAAERIFGYRPDEVLG
ncbi:MAG: PAS domain-containing protein, partial [Acidimicrobiia bacterium]